MAKKSEMQLSALRDNVDNRKKFSRATCDMLLLLAQNGYVRTGYYTGNGRNTKAVDNTESVRKALKLMRISHAAGNDAPRGGVTGNYVVLTSNAIMQIVGKTDTYKRLRKQAGAEWKFVVKHPYSHDELLEQARKTVEWVTDEYKDEPDGRYWLNVYHGAEVYELIIQHGRIVGSIREGFNPTIPGAENRISPERQEWIDVLTEVVSERIGNAWNFVKADGSGTSFFLREVPFDKELKEHVKVYEVPDMQWGGMRTNYEITGVIQQS